MASWQSKLIFAGSRYRPLLSPSVEAAPLRRARRGFERTARLLGSPSGVRFEAFEAEGLRGEWVLPGSAGVHSHAGSAASHGRTLLYLHGGGYVIGSPRTHRSITGRLALGCEGRVLAPDYRLAPEHPFPAALEDALVAYRWLLASGTRPASIVVGGDSAGGGLALSLALALRDAGDPLPAALVLVSPLLDLAFESPSLRINVGRDGYLRLDGMQAGAAAYRGGVDAKDPRVSPLHAELMGLPPTLIQVGQRELLRDDARRLDERLRAVGAHVELDEWEGMIHVWHALARFVPEGVRALGRVAEFVTRRTELAAERAASAGEQAESAAERAGAECGPSGSTGATQA